MTRPEPTPDSLHLLAIGAHPDDCELFAGGMLAALCAAGWRVAALDLTRGEAASRGTPEERAAEARRAASILGLRERVTLDLGDAGLENTAETRGAVVEALRRLRPRAVVTHHPDDRHPDHVRAHHLAREACFYASVGRFPAEGERLASPPALFYFFGNPHRPEIHADFIVPLDEALHERKRQAIAAYASQFHNPDYAGPPTLISSRGYAEAMDARARWFGLSVGAPYGEPYALDQPPAIADPLAQLLGMKRVEKQAR
ncbi:MAG: bacillithiol biosynthesis deacetylase BshB1 [Candidatus Sumerlaeota bacterium]|nr:bacillithiol biosynthesis deacetylase BshB1 [Candidatus Sumerlaeota bacterium]